MNSALFPPHAKAPMTWNCISVLFVIVSLFLSSFCYAPQKHRNSIKVRVKAVNKNKKNTLTRNKSNGSLSLSDSLITAITPLRTQANDHAATNSTALLSRFTNG